MIRTTDEPEASRPLVEADRCDTVTLVQSAGDEYEASLDRALADTFPASDPIARQVPSTVGR